MFCKDKSISHLNEMGWNAVSLPREKINPLQVLSKANDHLEILGNISDFLITGPTPPNIEPDQAADIAGLQSDKYEMAAGLSLLQRLLSYLGAGAIELKASFNKADSIQFTYENVLIDIISIRGIERYLTAVVPDLSSRILEEVNDAGELYIVTDTLKSNSFGVIAYDSSNNAVEIDITGLKDLLSTNFKINLSKTTQNVLSFKGEKHLRFAFKATGLWLDIGDGKATFRLHPPAGPIAPMKALPASLINPHEATPVIFGRNTLIKIK